MLLPPFQVSVLGRPSPSVTPTNLLYNVVATPSALLRYWWQGQTGGRLTAVLLAGTIPGVVAGSTIRVELVPGPEAFEAVIGAVLVPLGLWLALSATPASGSPRFSLPAATTAVLAALVGVVGGIYGIGGGSILAPLLVIAGRSPRTVRPRQRWLQPSSRPSSGWQHPWFCPPATTAPSPPLGCRCRLGHGRPGGRLPRCTRAQPHLPDMLIRRVLGVLVMAIGARYAYLAVRN